MTDYYTFLEEEFQRRILVNKNYSLRAFARDLSISASQLSEIMNRKGGLSPSKAVEVAQALELDSSDADYFIELVKAKHDRSKRRRSLAESEVISRIRLQNRKFISCKHFPFLNWLGFAIRRLSEHKDFRPDAAWIADRFGVSVDEVKPRLDYLLKNKFIVKKNGQWGINENVMYSSSSHEYGEIRFEFHKEALDQVVNSLTSEDLPYKDFAAHAFSLNKSQVAKIKDLIRRLEDQIDKITYETGDDPEEVYYFTSFLFPLTKKKSKEGIE